MREQKEVKKQKAMHLEENVSVLICLCWISVLGHLLTNDARGMSLAPLTCNLPRGGQFWIMTVSQIQLVICSSQIVFILFI